MPKKGEPMSEELKAKLAAGRAAKLAQKDEYLQKQTSPEINNPVPQEHGSEDPNVAALTKMVLELKQQLEQTTQINQAFMAGVAQAPQQNTGSEVRNGRLIGVTEKYSVNPELYENPVPRLLAEPRLQRIAFNLNYELEWIQDVTSYETKDGVNMKEPKFTLRLHQIVLDDEGEPTNGRVGKAQMIFFEDPATAIVVAQQNGLPIDEENEQAFLNAMRYIRVRDWLFECFWPPVVKNVVSNMRGEVIGGQVVNTWQVSANEGSPVKIDYSSLGNKLRA